MQIEFDSAKRNKNLVERGLDFARAGEVFKSLHFTGQAYRFITVGLLDARLVVLVWTLRGEVRRIISLRKANDREKTFYAHHLD